MLWPLPQASELSTGPGEAWVSQQAPQEHPLQCNGCLQLQLEARMDIVGHTTCWPYWVTAAHSGGPRCGGCLSLEYPGPYAARREQGCGLWTSEQARARLRGV